MDTITVGASAEYFIMAVYSDGCEAASETLMGYGVTAVEETGCPVAIYPNPVENQLNIIAQHLQRVAIYNVMGQLVKTVEVGGHNRFELQVSDIPSGLYTLQIVTENGVASKNIIVK